ncbi:MAG: GtrA family protein [Acidimicrobiia bacterium]|nr:GtrA family protein [Acidimicrobiia bacterium]
MSNGTTLSTAFGKVRLHGLRYSAVSVVNVIIGQSLLFLFLNVAHIGAATSNVLAVCLSAVPAYYLSRAWVWGKRGKSHLTKEVLPFWGFALAGLLLSTAAVFVTSRLLDITPGEVEGWRRLVPNVANIGAFGVLWVVKFFVLDSMIFGPGSHHPDDVGAEDLGKGFGLLGESQRAEQSPVVDPDAARQAD